MFNSIKGQSSEQATEGQDGGNVSEPFLNGKNNYGSRLNKLLQRRRHGRARDATKIVRSAFQSTASVSALLLASGGIISNTSKKAD